MSNEVRTNGFTYLIEPPAAWVDTRPLDGGALPAGPRGPMHYEVIDEQVRVEAATASMYRRVIRVVNETAGLGNAAQIEAEFDPAYERLSFHFLRVLRGAEVIDKLGRGAGVNLLQRETRLESRTYDGRVTASVVLDDVRVGDRIEYAYTVRGSNPVFGGKYVDSIWTGAQKGATAWYRLRVLSPQGRTLRYSNGPDVKFAGAQLGQEQEMVFLRTAIPPWQGDDRVPGGAFIPHLIQLSEFASWEEVARWGAQLFNQPGAQAPSIGARAAAIRAAAATPEARLAMALDLVQNEIRYFGTQIGPYSHQPIAPDKVLEQRFGDCKGKVGLLIALLRMLEIEADPVLVSTFFRGDTTSLLPSAGVFDHVIARVRLGGKTLWLDGTREHQTGTLEERQTVGLSKGLVLADGEKALVDLPGTRDVERLRVEDVIRVPQFDQDALVQSRATFVGEYAEIVRGGLMQQPPDQLESAMNEEFSRYYPTARRTAPLRFEEVPGHNAVTMIQQFALPEFWSPGEQRRLRASVVHWGLVQPLRFPRDPARRLPFGIDLPGVYRHTTIVEFGEDVVRGSDTSRNDDLTPFHEFRSQFEIEPRRATYRSEVSFLKEQVAASEWSSYIDRTTRVQDRLVRGLNIPVISPAREDKLRDELRRFDAALRAGDRKLGVYTRVQAESRAQTMIVTAELEGGRLNARMRADALRRRGISLDQTGQSELARADFEEAMRLAPDDDEVLSAAAVNAFMVGSTQRALELGGKALQRSPSSIAPRGTLALASYAIGNYAEAKHQRLEMLKSTVEVERGYSAIWLYLAARRLGEDAAAAVQPYLPREASSSWPNSVLQFLLGKITYEQAHKAAVENSRDPSRLCELYYYVGEKYLIEGDTRRAKEYFDKSMDTKVVEFNEYTMAKRGLDRMAADAKRR